MLGVGRFGGILGASTGGFLLQAGVGFSAIFGLLAIPSLIAAAALIIKRGVSRSAQVGMEGRPL